MSGYYTEPDFPSIIKDIKGRLAALEVGTPRLYSEQLSEVSTTGTNADLGGPSVTIQVPVRSFVVLYAQADIQALGGGGVQGVVSLQEVNGDFGASSIMNSTGAYSTLGTVPGNGAGSIPPNVGPLTFPASPGVRTYKMLYSISSGFTGFFKNRKLWVWTLG